MVLTKVSGRWLQEPVWEIRLTTTDRQIDNILVGCRSVATAVLVFEPEVRSRRGGNAGLICGF